MLKTRSQFDSFDAFAEAIGGWDLSFRQLDCGSGSFGLRRIESERVVLQSVSFGRRVHQQGAPPPGFRTLGIVTQKSESLCWNSRYIDDHAVLAFHPANEYDSVSAAGFSGFTLSIEEGHLNRLSQQINLPAFADRSPQLEHAATIDFRDFESLKVELSNLVSVAFRVPAASQGALLKHLDFHLPYRFLSAMGQGSDGGVPITFSRARVLRKAIDFLEENRMEPVSVASICEACGVNPRTLQRIFLDHFGVTPKAYVNRSRLNGVHRELRRASADGKVVDIANNWGFWHMGQFAADYRKLFGELPSVTLEAE